MSDTPACPSVPLVHVTLLPNGGSPNKLKFTALFTPALDCSDTLPGAFVDWPANWNSLWNNPDPTKKNWTLTVIADGVTKTCKCQPVASTLRSDAWTALFDGKLNVVPRGRNADFVLAWLLSHDAQALYDRHDRYRTWDALHRLASSNSQLITEGAPSPPNADAVATLAAATALPGELAAIAASVAPNNVYLFSSVTPIPKNPAKAAKPVALKRMFADRQKAIDFAKGSVFSTLPYASKLSQRIHHAQSILEEEEGERLTGPALMAVYYHCLLSIGSAAGNIPPAQNPKTIADGVAKAALNLVTADGILITDKDFTDILDYVEFHLFTKRPVTQMEKSLPSPDFHQLLGLLHQYPALLRPLGLAFDFVAVDASSALPANSNSVVLSITPPDIADVDFSQKIYTKCVLRPDFAAYSRDNQHKNRFLDISDVNNYTFVTEDSDGSSHKLIQQKAAQSRGSEFDTNAPSGLAVQDSRVARGPLKSLPSSRTTGIALYQGDRAARLADSIVRNTPTLGSAPGSALCIEDVTLGYRVDIKKGEGAAWYSLHQRRSSYSLRSIDGTKELTRWAPDPSADEGFITLAVTSTVVPPFNGEPEATQLQVHQALVTWTGWSLSVPRPKTPKKFNDVAPQCTDGPTNAVRVRPTYELLGKGTLPKLRFEGSYEIRLRHVDLAGNSVPLSNLNSDGASQPLDEFLRHEPIRAPQILLVEPIDRVRQPSEHVDLMVSRDGSSSPERVLVPPRETHYLAELHGMLEKLDPIPTAFSRQHLMANGAFPSVAQAFPDHPGLESEKNDAVFVNIRDSVTRKSFPTTPYLPDPLAIFSRIEPYVLADDLATYLPAKELDQKTTYPPIYLPFLADTKWPDTLPNYVQLNPVGKDKPLRITPKELPLKPGVADVPVYGLVVELPEAATVMLQITSASNDPSRRAPPLVASSDLSFLSIPEQLNQLSPVRGTVPPPPVGQRVNLVRSFENLSLPEFPVASAPVVAATTPASSPVSLGPGDLSSAINLLNDILPVGPPSTAPSPPAPAPVPIPAAVPAASPDLRAAAFNNLQKNVTQNQNLLTDGSVHTMTPPRKLTLVHAVRTPLDHPSFEVTAKGAPGFGPDDPIGCCSSGTQLGNQDIVNFPVERAPGASAATMSGKLGAHWASTSKVTITAQWTDRIDDMTKSAPVFRTTHEVAAELINDGTVTGELRGIKNTQPPNSPPSNQHRFRDTRAHSVKYSLSAFTRFREYYPSAEAAEKFTVPGPSYTACVLSSARPPAPTISYIIPAFSWKDSDNMRGRTTVLRIYLQRPFLVSGDNETLGVVLQTGSPNPNTALVSRWGADPIVITPGKIVSNEMKAGDFIALPQPGNPTSKPKPWVAATCTLSEGGIADVLPFNVDYAEDRGLWYCDVPMAPSQTESAFARLALVRWQPNSLNHGGINDLRASQVVFADFIQIRADRWVSVDRPDPHSVTVAISGIFRTPDTNPNYPEAKEPTFRCRIQQRWHRLSDEDKNSDWRPLQDAPAFTHVSCDAGGISTWSSAILFKNSPNLHSTNLFKYRLVIEEKEYMSADSSKEFNHPTADGRGCRYTFLHYIEL